MANYDQNNVITITQAITIITIMSGAGQNPADRKLEKLLSGQNHCARKVEQLSSAHEK